MGEKNIQVEGELLHLVGGSEIPSQLFVYLAKQIFHNPSWVCKSEMVMQGPGISAHFNLIPKLIWVVEW